MPRAPRRRSAAVCCVHAWLLLGVALASGLRESAAAERPAGPDELYGPLFEAVQLAEVFPDQKTFVDAVPRAPVHVILEAFAQRQPRGRVALARFVEEHFLLPEARNLQVPDRDDLDQHIDALWDLLRRQPDRRVTGSSLLPLPRPYIVPGGRFREIYYWDSYFTLLGLQASGRHELVESMLDNFAYLAINYGMIPNGNRTYYLSRSQPPFFAAMVELLAAEQGAEVYAKYRDALRVEYAYWNDDTAPTLHRVPLPGGFHLQRYYDQRRAPRPESYRQDVRTAAASDRPPDVVYRELRSAAESGWDFSSRWFGRAGGLPSLRTTEFLPVDLNCLLWQLEQTLARAEEQLGNTSAAAQLRAAAERRGEAIRRFCWAEAPGFFVDYDLTGQRPHHRLTLAGLFPLYFGLATDEQADAVATIVRERFLQAGGVVTTLEPTGEQWDWPNGWAPLQWVTVRGLERYGHSDLARTIATRWVGLNTAVFERTGKLMEKYNVVDTSLLAGGGEYDAQDGFGWTNGVLVRLRRLYGEGDPAAKTAPAAAAAR